MKKLHHYALTAAVSLAIAGSQLLADVTEPDREHQDDEAGEHPEKDDEAELDLETAL